MEKDATYIFLYRKLLNHSIFQPGKEKDLRVFLWILLRVDYQTGEMKSGRNWSGEILGYPPTTFRDILHRLEKTYQLIAIKPANKSTTIRVLKWSKFQAPPKNPTANPPTNRQQTATNQEIKKLINNKYIYTVNPKSKTLETDKFLVKNHLPPLDGGDPKTYPLRLDKPQAWKFAILAGGGK